MLVCRLLLLLLTDVVPGAQQLDQSHARHVLSIGVIQVRSCDALHAHFVLLAVQP